MKTDNPQPRRKKAAIHTLGCKVNQVESAQIAGLLEQMGYEVVFGFPSTDVDLAVVNTCAVTHKAEAESRRALLRMARAGGATIATGCSAQLLSEELVRRKEVDFIVGTNRKRMIAQIAGGLEQASPGAYVGDILREKAFEEIGSGYLSSKTRAFLKAQDGCSSFCSYCVVPYARGPSRSLDPPTVLKRFRELVSAGFREIVLTGVHLGMYGVDLAKGASLLELLRALEDEEFDGRIRLSSLEPTEVSGDMIDFLKRSRLVCPHLHLPLQSGDRAVLRRMNRRYEPEQYADVALALNEAIPHIALGADALVGFPGEDSAAFEHTARLIERLPLAHLHVFPYSPRTGTPAANMGDQVSDHEKKRRVALLRELGVEKKKTYFAKLIGSRAQVLAQEGPDENGLWRGLSERYVPVLFELSADRADDLVLVTLTGAVDHSSGPAMTGVVESL